jgi:TolB protein
MPPLPLALQGQEIAFASQRNGDWDIWLARLDGSLLLNLTDEPADEGAYGPFIDGPPGYIAVYGFSWAPDGRALAYGRGYSADTVPFVCVVGTDGVGPTCLTTPHEVALAAPRPSWAPAGRQLAIIAPYPGFRTNVVRVDLDLSSLAALTEANEYNLYEAPAWSPDGDRIAFLVWDYLAGDENGVGLVDPDGSDLILVTDRTRPEIQPARPPTRLSEWAAHRQIAAPSWSPDGAWVAFTAYDATGVQVFRVRRDGTELTRLTQEGGDWPQWSPDGSRILFVSLRDNPAGGCEIYVMGAAGSAVDRLTDSRGLNLYPAWSPDGAYIAFASYRDGNWEVYVMKADGSMQTDITNHPAHDTFPVWRPRGP